MTTVRQHKIKFVVAFLIISIAFNVVFAAIGNMYVDARPFINEYDEGYILYTAFLESFGIRYRTHNTGKIHVNLDTGEYVVPINVSIRRRDAPRLVALSNLGDSSRIVDEYWGEEPQ